MCSRPASPNCPGSLFTSIRHFPPVIVANAHCTPLMIGEHTREKKPFYNSIFFHRRPYRLKLPLPRSDNSFALLAPTGFLHRVYSGLIRPAVHLLFHPIFWQLYFLSRTTRTRTLQCKLTKYTKVLRTPNMCTCIWQILQGSEQNRTMQSRLEIAQDLVVLFDALLCPKNDL